MIYPRYNASISKKVSNTEIISVDLSIEDISDSYNKAIAKHDFPRVNGVTLEDLGMGAREIRFRCYFNDTDSVAPFDNQYKLLKLMQIGYTVKNPLEFIHPNHGLIRGAIENIETIHDHRVNMVVCDVLFIQDRMNEIINYNNTPDSPVVEAPVEIEDVVDEQYYEIMINAINDFINKVKDFLNDQWGFLLEYIDFAREILSQIRLIGDNASSVLRQIDGYWHNITSLFKEFDYTYNQFKNIFNDYVNYPENFTRKIIKDTAFCFYKADLSIRKSKNITATAYIREYNRVANDIETFVLIDPKDDPIKKKTNYVLKSLLDVIRVAQLSKSIASIYSDDDKKRQVYRRLEKINRIDYLGNRINREELPDILTLDDIERSLYDVRVNIQDVVDSLRAIISCVVLAQPLSGSFVINEYCSFSLSGAKGKFLEMSESFKSHSIKKSYNELLTTNEYKFSLYDNEPQLLDVITGISSGATAKILSILSINPISNGDSINNLLKMALLLQQNAINVKIETERIIEKTVFDSTPMHALCNNYGLSYEYAERVLKINPLIWNPNFTRGKVNIYAQQEK